MKENFNFKETNFDGIGYMHPTWEEMGRVSFELAKEINESGERFDRLVALAKGGWTWARTTVDNLNIEHLSSIRVKSYNGVNSNSRIDLIQPLTDLVNGEKILIFDDVADSGETLKFAKDYILGAGASEVKMATLCSKPRSCISPDFYGFQTSAWIIFPHEIREFINGSGSTWLSKGVQEREVRERFLEIGLPIEQVDYFMSRAGFKIE